MSEPNQAGGTRAGQSAWFCDWLREGAEKAAEAMSPPEDVARHFREARLEVLRGIRDFIDHRIERLSKDTRKGSHIVVE